MPLPSPAPLGLGSSLSPSPQNTDEDLQSSLQEEQHISYQPGEKSPVSRAAGRTGCAPPGSSRAPRGSEGSSLKSADAVRHAQAKSCSNSLIIKIPGRSSV